MTRQQFKNRKTLYGHLPPNNTEELKPWDTVHIYLIGPYIKSIIKHHPDGTAIQNNYSLTCTTMIELATCWFEIVEIPTFDLEEVKIGNDECIYKSSAGVSLLFNNTWICIYPRPQMFVFDNGSKFKRDFTPLLKDFNIKTVLTLVKNPQANAPVERVHQVILNMLGTKDLDNKVFDYIDTWGETLAYILWAIRASYHFTIMATPGQALFGIDMLFNLA